MIDGDTPTSATAYVTVNGTEYAVSTTIRYGYKPASNSTVLTVSPQSTEATTPTKTPEQMEEEAKTKGLHVWGPDSFSIFPPFMRWHARVLIDSLGIDVHSWIGLGDCGIDAYAGLGRLVEKAFENVPLDMLDIVTSAFVSSITATTTLFIASWLLATFTSMTPSYWLTLLAYSIGGGLALAAAYAWPEARLSKAILYGIGATLFSLIIGAYAINILRDLPFFIIAELTGPPYIQLATKAIVNTLVRNYLGVTSIALQVTFKSNPLLIPFAVITLGLAALAIYLGWTRN